ncbi:MAG TPA: Gfo/Idh/MocA family oxidoreductase [Opitutales bacterium]|nr:Gfo/Idh/MocA family oxidoreductase [Opitutales bacterium]
MAAASIWAPRDVIRWGILGCGDVTEVKSGPGFQKCAGSQLVAVMRRKAELAEDYARRHGVPKWTADAAALIHDPEVDAVYIATPPGAHLDLALQVAAAGKPCHVEKPMARNFTECEKMNAAFAKARLPLFVAYYRRAQPRFLKAKELIETALGRVTQIHYQFTDPRHAAKAGELPWRLDAENAGGGFFLDLGSHTLDLLDFFFGALENVAGDAANLASAYDVEDTLAMSFRTHAGAPGTAAWNFAGAVGQTEDFFQITGTEGRLTFSTFGNEPLRLELADGRIEEFSFMPLPHVAQPLIQTVVDDLRGHGKCPSTGETAARTTRVMDRVLDSYYGGRGDAFWKRKDTWPGRRDKKLS